MVTNISRRSLLAGISILPIMTGPSAFLFSARPAQAVEPATITAATAIVGAISNILAPRPSSVELGSAGKAYFDQIIDNQRRISRQVNEVSAQMRTLAEQLAITPPQTVVLDKRVSATSVYHSAMAVEISFLRAVQRGNPDFGKADKTRFAAVLEDIRRSAGDHIAIAQDVGQPIDIIVAVDALRLALEAMVNAARIADFTTSGHKRNLETTLELITRGAKDIHDGRYKPKLGSFVAKRDTIRRQIAVAVTRMAAFERDSKYTIFSNSSFYTKSDPKLLKGYYYTHDTVETIKTTREKCTCYDLGRDFGRRGTDRGLYGCQDLANMHCIEIPEYLKIKVPKYSGSAAVEKTVLLTPDKDQAHFVLTIKPRRNGSKYVALMEKFNAAKVRDQIYHSAALVLRRIIDEHERVAEEIRKL